jgi:lipoteichoic acid synthase
MHILNHPVPAQWQGRSFFSPRKTNRTYFFAAYSSFLFGYREGDQKYILNGTFRSQTRDRLPGGERPAALKRSNRLNEAKQETNEIYDLREDPTEMANLSDRLPDAVSRGQQRLAAWVQYQNKFINSLLVEK